MISMVAAMGRNNVIGNRGHLPWAHDMLSDIKRYTELIRGRTIVMGANTFGKADHSRSESRVVVLSRRDLDLPKGVRQVHSVEDVLALDESDGEIFITGGGGVYHLMIAHADRIFLTVIDKDFEGDVLFPVIDDNAWTLATRQDFEKDDRNKYAYSFLTYRREVSVLM